MRTTGDIIQETQGHMSTGKHSTQLKVLPFHLRKYLHNCHASDVGEPFDLGVDAGTFEGDSLPMQMLRLLVRSLPQ